MGPVSQCCLQACNFELAAALFLFGRTVGASIGWTEGTEAKQKIGFLATTVFLFLMAAAIFLKGF